MIGEESTYPGALTGSGLGTESVSAAQKITSLEFKFSHITQ